MQDLKYDYLILGGGIAGVTAAENIREKDTTATIGIISDEPHLIYSRVLIPSYLKKRISREQLFLRRPEDFTKAGIDLHLGQSAVSLDTKFKSVQTESGTAFGYRKLLLTTGGKVKPWGKKEYLSSIYRMQTIDDADRIFADLTKLNRPLVVGSSFISLEFLEVFLLNQITPTLLSREPYFFGKIFDAKGGELLRVNFERHGIQSFFGDGIKEVRQKGPQFSVMTERLEEVLCDAFGVGVGIERHTGFLSGSGVELGEKGIKTNKFLETNTEDVFAAGDIAEFYDLILGKHRLAGNWTNAFLQGKLAGQNMAGGRAPFRNVSAYSITNLGFQITALGECAPDAETIVRVDPQAEQYERFFIKNGVLVGAALINRFKDKPHIAKLIESKTSVEEHKEKLADFRFDIQTIPLVG